MIPIIEKIYLQNIPKKNRNQIMAVILAPSRELAEQIGAVGRALTKGMWLRVSDTSQSDKSITTSTILCATPNKIITMCDRKEIDLSNCKFLILDECDKMLEIVNKENPNGTDLSIIAD